MTLRLHKDFFNFPSGCLKKSQPIAVSSPAPSALHGSQYQLLLNLQQLNLLNTANPSS
jgi:hypothetical protein